MRQSKKDMLVLILVTFSSVLRPIICQSGGAIFSRMGIGGMAGGMGSGMGGGGGGMGGMGGVRGQMGANQAGLPPGYANIRGEIMDMSNKVIQRVTAAGTNYFAYDKQDGAPIFRRREIDAGRRFVLFPDLAFPPGDGHYIVMRKMPGVNIPGMIPQLLYETFRLSLGDSVHAYVEAFKRDEQPQNVNQGGYNGLAGGHVGQSSGFQAAGAAQAQNQMHGGMAGILGKRRKRTSQQGGWIMEMTPMDVTNSELIQGQEDVAAAE